MEEMPLDGHLILLNNERTGAETKTALSACLNTLGAPTSASGDFFRYNCPR
jgi:hypothetical protein